MIAALYVFTLALGTYIGQLFVLSKAFASANAGGVVASIVTLVRPLQPSKALIPIVVILFGIVTLVRLVQL